MRAASAMAEVRPCVNGQHTLLSVTAQLIWQALWWLWPPFPIHMHRLQVSKPLMRFLRVNRKCCSPRSVNLCNLLAALHHNATMPVAAFDFAESFTTKPGLLHVEQGFSAHRQQCLHVIALQGPHHISIYPYSFLQSAAVHHFPSFG